MKLRGKGALIWQLRNWQGGDPAKQVAEALALGLAWVSIKIVDGCRFRWESGKTTNADLMPAAVAALRAAGIQVHAWGWLWGNKVIWDFDKGFWVNCTPQKEASAAIAACRKYRILHFQINAEAAYRKHANWAEAYCRELNSVAPDIEYSLCAYRYPITAQPDFPTATFAPQVDAWTPQVYFLLDNRLNGGAIQLAESLRQYGIIRDLPYIPVAPTYPYGYKDAAGNRREWRASKAQLLALFNKAKALGCPGVSVWDLAQATPDQKAALAELSWTAPVPPPDLYLVLVDGNLRAGPGTSFPIIRLIKAGETVQQVGLKSGDWWNNIKAGGDIGWFWNPSSKLQAIT